MGRLALSIWRSRCGNPGGRGRLQVRQGDGHHVQHGVHSINKNMGYLWRHRGQPRLWPKTAQPSPCSRPVAHSPPSTPRPPLPSTLSLASASKVDLSTPPIRSTHPPALSSIRPLAPSTAKASLILVSQELRQRWPPCRSPLQLLNSLICR